MPINIGQINTWSQKQFIARLGGIFEHSPWVAEAAWTSIPFADIDSLHAAMVAAVRSAPHARQLAFLRAHPELAGRAMVDQSLTAESANEQTRSGLTQCTPAEFARLQELNTAYKRKFGWPFILAVLQLDRQAIIRIFAERLEKSAADEFESCLVNIEKITRLRLDMQIGEA